MRRIGGLAGFAACWLAAAGALAQPQEVFTGGCYPACREGYVCNPNTGQCVSACNPPCGAGQTCTAGGQCVAETPAAPTGPVGTVGTPIVQTAPAAAPVVALPAPVERAHPAVAALLRAGPQFGWLNGGTLGFGVAIRLARVVLLDLEVRGAGGAGGGSVYALGAGELTVRIAPPERVTWMVRGGVGAGFLAEYETGSGEGYDYSYRVAYARLGAGALFKKQGRSAIGLELAIAAGSAAQVDNYVDLEDYGGFYGEVGILGLFSF